MPLKVHSSVHHSEAEKVWKVQIPSRYLIIQMPPKCTRRILLHCLSSVLYLHIQKHFPPSEALGTFHKAFFFFLQKNRRKIKSRVHSYYSKHTSTCYKIMFFNWKIIARFFFSNSYTDILLTVSSPQLEKERLLEAEERFCVASAYSGQYHYTSVLGLCL